MDPLTESLTLQSHLPPDFLEEALRADVTRGLTATPKTLPSCRVMFRMPLATPALLRGTAFMAMVEAGELISPAPQPTEPDAASTRWTPDAEAELRKIPFFVRGKARRNTERFASERGVATISVDTLYEAKAHYAR